MWHAQAWQFGMCGKSAWENGCLLSYEPKRLVDQRFLDPKAMDDFNTPWKTNGWNTKWRFGSDDFPFHFGVIFR